VNLDLYPFGVAFADVAAALHASSGLPEAWDAAAFVQLLTLPGIDGRIATVDEGPAGLILWRVAADEAEILTLAVSPPLRRCGIGRTLCLAAAADMRRMHISSCYLEVSAANVGALSLYRTLNFEEAGRRRGYYPSLTGDARDALILMCRFNDETAIL
jgi:ribosomal-protein-alanine N-acetyltransferase